MASYTPPPAPAPTGNVVGDIERAFSWMSEFFSVRAPVIRMVSDINIATIRRLF